MIHVDVWKKLTQYCNAIILQFKKNFRAIVIKYELPSMGSHRVRHEWRNFAAAAAAKKKKKEREREYLFSFHMQ